MQSCNKCDLVSKGYKQPLKYLVWIALRAGMKTCEKTIYIWFHLILTSSILCVLFS